MDRKPSTSKDSLIPRAISKMRGEVAELDGIIRYLEEGLQNVKARRESIYEHMPTDDLIRDLLSRGWSQASVAEYCGLGQATISRWVYQHSTELGAQGYHPKRGPKLGSKRI